VQTWFGFEIETPASEPSKMVNKVLNQLNKRFNTFIPASPGFHSQTQNGRVPKNT
jgi:hypothetical protein